MTLKTSDVLELHGHDAAAAGLFLLSDGAREWRARAVLLATGLRDELPSVPGVKELWRRRRWLPSLPRLGGARRGARVRVLSRPVARLDHDDSRLRSVVFDDGAELPRRAVFVPFLQRQHTGIAARAGCATVASGVAVDAIATDWTGVTSVPGIWAAGTTTNPALLAIGSAGHGSFVATQLHASLMSR